MDYKTRLFELVSLCNSMQAYKKQAQASKRPEIAAKSLVKMRECELKIANHILLVGREESRNNIEVLPDQPVGLNINVI